MGSPMGALKAEALEAANMGPDKATSGRGGKEVSSHPQHSPEPAGSWRGPGH